MFFQAAANQERQKGQGMTEYLVVGALIAVGAIVVFSMFGQVMRYQASGVSQELAGNNSKPSIKEAKKKADFARSNGKYSKKMDDYKSTVYLQKVYGNNH